MTVYFEKNIADVLRSTASSCEGPLTLALDLAAGAVEMDETEQERLLVAYHQGVRQALVSVGLAFGLVPVEPGGERGLMWVPREQ